MSRKRSNLATYAAEFFAISFIIFLAVSQVLGVPLWWIFGNVNELSSVRTQWDFQVSVNPETPLVIGDNIEVTVKNMTDRLPVDNAEVTVRKDGASLISLQTDSKGQVSFEYPGEPTIITVEKEAFKNSMKVIPKLPDAWVRDLSVSGIIGPLIGAVITYRLAKRNEKATRKRSKPAKEQTKAKAAGKRRTKQR